MCLNSRFSSLQEALDRCPGETFHVYKVLKKNGDKLVSPSYTHKAWKPGVIKSSGQNRSNGDSGIYVFLADPGSRAVKEDGKYERIVRMTAAKEDIVWGGRDSWNSRQGTCLVMRQVHISEEDYAAAMDDELHEYELAEARKEAKVTVAAAKGQVAENRAKLKETEAEAETKKVEDTAVAKSTIKKAKKTKVKAVSKKAVKKMVKKGKEMVKKATKGTSSAKATIKKAKKVVKAAAKKSKWDKFSTDDLKVAAKVKGVKGSGKMSREKLIAALDK